ncbi:MAG: hypothetical protein WEB00_02345 [Dehalococcoidia bacterium]
MLKLLATAVGLGLALAGFVAAEAKEPRNAEAVIWDDRSEPLEPGKTTAVGFMILAGGKCVEALQGQAINPYIEATNLDSGETVRFDATVDRPLHFSADVNLPSRGQWELRLRSDRFPIVSAQIVLVGAEPPALASVRDSSSDGLLPGIGDGSLAGLVAGLGIVATGAAFGVASVRRQR